MNEVVGKTFTTLAGVVLLIAIATLFSGTILWAAWDSLHVVFPTANADLGIPKELEWWTAIKFSFICSTVFRSFGASASSIKSKS